MAAIKKVDLIWSDGKFIPWDSAQDHVLTHSLHYGVGVFEGIRAYKRQDGRTAIFRLREHIDRLFDGCHIATLDCPYSKAQLTEACADILRQNRLQAAYLRPLVYIGYGGMGLGSTESPVRVIIAAYEWGAYLGDDGLKKGVRCKVSAFRRGNVDGFMSKGKISGQYVTSVLAKRDAVKSGFDEAIMLDPQGLVAEATGENIFMVKNGVVRTAPLSASILAGITRDTVITLLREANVEVREQSFTRDDLWTADEVFLTGTAAEITPVREIDHRRVGTGEPGAVTRNVQERFFHAVSGSDTAHPQWLSYV